MVRCDMQAPDDLALKFAAAASTSVSAKDADKQLINLRLKGKTGIARTAIKPRGYQIELFEKALKENVIIYLATGLGKTFITVLYVNSPLVDAEIQKGRKVIFLAPTQDLVQQQAAYLYKKVPYKVRVYCGRTCATGLHIDKWKDEEWERQFQEIDIMFMTPQIFSNAIIPGFIKWNNLAAVIFDEVHHAHSMKRGNSGHPYSKALDHYHFWFSDLSRASEKPRIIGLTASLMNNLPSDLSKISLGIQQLEKRIEGQCITSGDAIDSKPLMIVHTHANCDLDQDNDIICDIFLSYAKRMKEALGITDKNRAFLLQHGLEATNDDDRSFLAYHERLNLASSGISIKPGSFHKVLHQLVRIRQSSGLWTFANICYSLVCALDKHAQSRCILESVRPLYRDFKEILNETLMSIDRFVGCNWNEILLEFSQPKLLALLSIFKKEHERILDGTVDKSTFSCIVFVQSRVEVFSLHSWLNMVSIHCNEYDFLKVGYAIGMSATAGSKWACITKRRSAEQSATLDSFRRGDLNVVVTTSVLEEGIDLPVCSTVIRFDAANSFRVYIQSRGRARQLKSSFISLADRDNADKVTKSLYEFNQFDAHIKQALCNRDIAMSEHMIRRTAAAERAQHDPSLYDDEAFEIPGVHIDSCTGAVLLNMYCAHMSRRYPFSNGATFRRFQPSESTYQTGLKLPIGSRVKHEILGNVKISIDLANKSATICAIRALHKEGEINDRGVSREWRERADEVLQKYKLQPDLSPIDIQGEQLEEVREDKQASAGRKLYTYNWRAFNLGLSERLKASSQRLLKLIKVVFEPVRDRVRQETESYFVQTKFGIILDSARDCSLWPAEIYSHYGVFNVRYELVKDNIVLDEHSQHNDLFNYTHRMVQFCWSIGNINKNNFSSRCLFYFVPLDSRNQIDWRKVGDSFHIRPNRELRNGDVVKLAKYYASERDDSRKLFVVRRVRTDMNALSFVPGLRDKSFLDQMRLKHGYNVRNHSQPVIEVMPIARSVASYCQGKKRKTDFSSRSLFYLRECLDFFDDDATSVLQAFNLPPIVYKLYLSALCTELDRKFTDATRERRNNVIVQPVVADNEQANMDDNVDEANGGEQQESMSLDQQPAEAQEMHELNDDDVEQSESETDSSFDDDSSRYDSSLDESDGGEPEIGQDASEDWKRYEDSLSDRSPLTIQREFSLHSQRYINTHPNFSAFASLRSTTEPILGRLLYGLQRFRSALVGSTTFTGEEQLLIRDGAKVDLSIKPPIQFDRVARPIRAGKSREAAILEALTQRRATEEFNLEALENVGDSYLKYCTSVALFKLLKGRDEGLLTSARSRLIGNANFTQLARRHELGAYVVANKFSEKSMYLMLGANLEAKGVLKNTLKEKALADTLESLVGAYLVYCGEFEAILAIDWLGLHLISDNMFCELHERAVVFAPTPSSLSIYGGDVQDSKVQQLFKANEKRVSRLQEILGYTFTDASYLIQALTHGSAPMSITESYERLEFLGDAILDYLITMSLYNSGLTTDPGQLTTSRSALVNNCTFARLAIKYRFDIFLQHANQDLLDKLTALNDQTSEDPEMNFFDRLEFDDVTKLMADIFEAVAGAIYLDSGNSLDAVWSIYYPMMKDLIDKEIETPSKNPISQIYEKYVGRVEFKFDRVVADGGSQIVCEAFCIIDGAGKYCGLGMQKDLAKKRAAEVALREAPPLSPRPRRANRPRQDRQGGSRGRAYTGSYGGRPKFQTRFPPRHGDFNRH